MFLSCALWVCAASSACAASSVEALRNYLDQYVGSWKGEASVKAANGEILQTFPVAAEYWASDKRLKGLTAFELAGEMSFVESESYIRNRLLFADVTQDGKTITYRGFLGEEELRWLPYDAELNTERRMKEWFSEEDGRPVLHVLGEELLRSDGGVAKILLEVRLVRQ